MSTYKPQIGDRVTTYYSMALTQDRIATVIHVSLPHPRGDGLIGIKAGDTVLYRFPSELTLVSREA